MFGANASASGIVTNERLLKKLETGVTIDGHCYASTSNPPKQWIGLDIQTRTFNRIGTDTFSDFSGCCGFRVLWSIVDPAATPPGEAG